MTIKGFPSSQKLPLGTGITNEFATVVPTDQYRNSLDVNRPLFRVTTIKTAAASTGNVDGVTWVYDTSTLAKKGDIVRFETGNAQYIEIPIVKVETNRFLLGAYLTSAPAAGDTFYILRSVSPRVDSTGTASVTATSGPIQFKKDGVATEVSQDTVTPANTVPLPVTVTNSASAGPIQFTLDGTTTTVSQDTVTPANSKPLPVSVLYNSPDEVVSGTITTSSTVQIDTTGLSAFAFQVTGTWVGTIVIEGTIDGANWVPTSYVSLASGSTSASFTANTIGQGNCTGLLAIRLRGATLSSGSAIVSFRATTGVASVMLDNPLPIGSNQIGSILNVSGTVSLPTGASTSALQTSGNASLTSIDGKIPALVSGAVPSLMKVVKKDATVVTPYGTENNAVAVGNFLQKFRDAFAISQPDLTIWDQSWTNQGSGFVAAGGNSSGSSYMKVSMCPLTANSEYVLLSKQTFKFPTRLGYGLSISQRIFGQEVEVGLVGVDGTGAIENNTTFADLAISGTISVTSNVATINFATSHGLVGGDRISMYGNVDPRLNYGPTTVLAVPSATSITASMVTLAAATYTAGGFVRFEDPLVYAKNAIALNNDTISATTATINARRDGAKFRTSSTTVITTNATQANINNYTDSWVPTAENEFISTQEEMFFSSRLADTIINTSATSARYTNGIPDEEKDYKIRVRVKSLITLTIPIAKVVTVAKTGTTTATVTTDVAHNLTTSDYVQVTGARDQANFPNLTAQTAVLSIVSPTQFTCVIGAAVTASSAGGSVYKVQGSQLAPGIFTNAIQSISRTGNTLIVVTSATISGMNAGETISLHGCDATSMGLYDGPYKVLRVTTTTAYLESVGADFGSINCGGSLIKRTDARLHFIKMGDYTRNAVEISNARGIVDTSKAMTVNVANSIAVASGTISTVTASNTASPGFVVDLASAAITTTTTTAAITPSFGCSMWFSIPVTVVTGTSPTLDVSIEVAEDITPTNWYRVYDFPRITATGVYRSPLLPYNGSRVRYVQTVGGGTPSFTRTLNRYQPSIQAPALTQFIDRTIVLTTLNSVTPTYFCDGCTIFNVNVTATTVTTPPVLALEGSDDGVKFYVITTEIQTVANTATTMSVSGFSPRFVRVRVVTAGVSATLDNIVIKGVTNSTPKSSSSGRNRVAQLFNDYTSTSVTTAAYVQLTAATTANINKLEIFDSSGETLILAVGAAASEVDQFYILPGGNGSVDLFIPAGSRIAIKSKTATASVGLIAVNLYS